MKKQILVKLSNLGDAMFVHYEETRDISYFVNCEHRQTIKVFPWYANRGDVIVRFCLSDDIERQGEVCPVKHEEFV
jgi:hypothetical protein